jgi:DNA-binding CsgD family transcriptional regulator
MSLSFKIALKIGLVTSVLTMLFWLIGQLTLYRYLKIEYYTAIIAVAFLIIGLFISRSKTSHRVPGDNDAITELTQKELLIMEQIAAGKSNKEIAADNFVELSTVKTHINNIYSKLSVNSRKEAIKVYAGRSDQAKIHPFSTQA